MHVYPLFAAFSKLQIDGKISWLTLILILNDLTFTDTGLTKKSREYEGFIS